MNRLGFSKVELRIYNRGLSSYYSSPRITLGRWKAIRGQVKSQGLLFRRYLLLYKRRDIKNKSKGVFTFLDSLKAEFEPWKYYLLQLEAAYYLQDFEMASRLTPIVMRESLSKEDLSSEDRHRIFFLVAKTWQRLKKYRRAYLFFRLAANHKQGNGREIALAAYMQFILKNEFFALKLLKNTTLPEEGLETILFHVLRYKLYRKKESREYLRDRLEIIKGKYKSKPTFLFKMAYRYAAPLINPQLICFYQ